MSRIVVGFCITALTVVLGHSELSGSIPVPLLVGRADVIITGVVIDGTQSREASWLTVQIDRVIQGSARAGDLLTLSWQPLRQAILPPVELKGVRGLFFVKKDSSERLSVLSATANALDIRQTFFRLPAAAATPTISYAATDSAVDKVVRELLPTEDYRRRLKELTADLSIIDTTVNVTSTSKVLREVVQGMLLSVSPRDRETGLHALLVLGDVSALATVEQGQSQLLTSVTGATLTETIREYYRNPDPAGIMILGRMLQTSPNISLKRAAAAALAMIHTKSSLPYLAELLDSQDLLLLKYGVGGLAMFANGVPLGGSQPHLESAPYGNAETIAHSAMGERAISKRPSYYVGFWKQWWSEHQSQLTR